MLTCFFFFLLCVVIEDELLPLHLLIWAVETSMTTLTCTVEMWSWEGLGKQERVALMGLYVPYLLLGKFELQTFLGW